MSSPQEIAQTPPVVNREAAPRFQDRLDLLHDCADLRGTFPQNVELKFIYWEHGLAEDYRDEASLVQMATRLAPHCLQADRIGREVHQTIHTDPRNAIREYHILNDLLRKPDSQKSFTDWFGDVQSNAIEHVLALSLVMKRLGREEPASFFPFDMMEYSPTPSDYYPAHDPDETYLEPIQREAARSREREGVALRQIHEQAVLMGQDGKKHQIAITYGANHSLTSVAARELGAPITRVFLEKPSRVSFIQVERALRYQPADELEDLVSVAEAADDEAFLLQCLLDKLGSKIQRKQLLFARIGWLMLCAQRNTLRPEQKQKYADARQITKPYEDREAKIPFMKRPQIKKAIRTLGDLALEVSN